MNAANFVYIKFYSPMTKLFTYSQIRKIDAFTIAHEPVASIDLMERAASALALWISERYPKNSSFLFFAGPGNNGGDAWALARLLYLKGYIKLAVFSIQGSAQLSMDSEINKKRLIEQTQVSIKEILSEKDFPVIHEEDVIIDGLFGSGLSRPLDGLPSDLVQYINNSNADQIIAIDIPSGLFGEDNSKNITENIIKAQYTLSFQFPKLSFFFAENSDFIGEWHVLDIGLHQDYINEEPTLFYYISPDNARERLRQRKKFSHKGNYGHALLIAGSYGMMGAAILSAKSAVRAGTGLVTTHVPRLGVETIQQSVPESLISIDSSETQFSHYPQLDQYSAVGIGPGLGRDPRTKEGLTELLQEVKVPIIIDADGLNLLSTINNWKEKLPEHTVLTPHPKEFERLFGVFTDNYSRLQAQQKFSEEKNCIVVLKGAHTCITLPGGDTWFNTTGNPGMAKGGSGDVLTGLILGLLAQGYSCTDASILAVYLHGCAGDIAARQMGQHAMIPSDIIDNIGSAFNVIEEKKS
jgi:ADP-dependent NAD(P)H-hydrate dehydratase / NAD(P)H-hydrate epimerase